MAYQLYCPEGVKSSELAPAFLAKGLVIAGGLGTRKDTYFRIGYVLLVFIKFYEAYTLSCSHMGVTAADSARDDVDRIISVLKEVVAEMTGKA